MGRDRGHNRIMAPTVRPSGIKPLGDLPWGTHFCHFYGTREDLLETLVPYFAAGLKGGERCLWVVADPVAVEDARSAMEDALPEVERYRRSGALNLVKSDDWYRPGGVLALDGLLARWDRELAEALASGFAGLRANASDRRLRDEDWDGFLAFERGLDAAIRGKHLIIACSYALEGSRAAMVLDVVESHQFALVKRHGRWAVLEPQELRRARAEIERLNAELEGLEERARLFEREQRARSEAERALARLHAIQAVTEPALAHLGLDELLRELLVRLQQVLGADRAAVLLLDEERSAFFVRAIAGRDADLFRMRAPFPLTLPLASDVVAAGRALKFDELPPGDDPRWQVLADLVHVPRSGMGAPLRLQERTFGVVSVITLQRRRFSEQELDLLRVVADRVAPAIERARLVEELGAAREQQRLLSRRILTAQEEERRRIAGELHDELGQALTALKMQLQSLERRGAAAAVATQLHGAVASVDQAMEKVRDLALDLRPAVLDDLGLPAALRWYADRFARLSGLQAHFAIEPLPRLAPELETASFRVAQEALTNVARHARARSFWLALSAADGRLRLELRDDGTGFDIAAARERARSGAAMGLGGMEERVAALGGELHLRSSPGRSTEVRALFPLRLEGEPAAGDDERRRDADERAP